MLRGLHKNKIDQYKKEGQWPQTKQGLTYLLTRFRDSLKNPKPSLTPILKLKKATKVRIEATVATEPPLLMNSNNIPTSRPKQNKSGVGGIANDPKKIKELKP